MCCQFKESGCLGVQPKVGGKFLLKLNTGERPIANKYREGKMQRTLKRELKVLEIVKREAVGGSTCPLLTHPVLDVWGLLGFFLSGPLWPSLNEFNVNVKAGAFQQLGCVSISGKGGRMVMGKVTKIGEKQFFLTSVL